MNKPYLDIEAIKNASSLINSTLLSKGYINDKLLFNTIDWDDLSQDQPSQIKGLELTETLYKNDKNLINIIYSLVQSIDRNSSQSKTFNKVIIQKDEQIKTLEAKLSAMEQKAETCQRKLDEYNVDRSVLSAQIKELTKTNKRETQNFNKLNNWCNELKSKYKVEMRKKNLEINQLKDKLIDKRNLSNTLNVGIPLDGSKTNYLHEENNVNPAVIYNNNPSIQNPDSSNPILKENTIRLNKALSKEFENIIVDLTQLVENLIGENYKFSQFIQHVNTYYQDVNMQISSFNNNKNIQLPNPSSVIDLEALNKVSWETSNLVNDLESFEFVAKPLLNNIYKNYHYTSNLVEYALDPNSSLNNHEKSEKMNKLTEELAIVRKNWQDAIKTMEQWKRLNLKDYK